MGILNLLSKSYRKWPGSENGRMHYPHDSIIMNHKSDLVIQETNNVELCF